MKSLMLVVAAVFALALGGCSMSGKSGHAGGGGKGACECCAACCGDGKCECKPGECTCCDACCKGGKCPCCGDKAKVSSEAGCDCAKAAGASVGTKAPGKAAAGCCGCCDCPDCTCASGACDCCKDCKKCDCAADKAKETVKAGGGCKACGCGK